MALGTKTGINLENILAGRSAIKSARLNAEMRERELESDKAEERNILRALKGKSSGAKVGEDVPDPETMIGGGDNILLQGDEKPSAPARPSSGMGIGDIELTEEQIQDYAKNPKLYREYVGQIEGQQLMKRRYAANKAALEVSMPNATPGQIDAMAKMKLEGIERLLNMAIKGGAAHRKAAMDAVDTSSRKLLEVTQAGMGVQDQMVAEKKKQDAWTSYRDEKIASVNDPIDKEKVSKSMPSIYDANYIGQQLAESADVYNMLLKMRKEDLERRTKVDVAKAKAGKGTDRGKISDPANYFSREAGVHFGGKFDSVTGMVSGIDEDKRPLYNSLKKEAAKIYKNNPDLRPEEAFSRALDKLGYPTSKETAAPKEGKLYKKGGKFYKIVDGKPVEQTI